MKASIFTLLLIASQSSAGERWYTPEQVEMGQELFSVHCGQCHGKAAEGAPDWQQQLEDGSFPPPPLNGTGHAWHHQLSILRRSIREGGLSFGGKMPPFKDQLSGGEIDAIIAWLQSFWPDSVYLKWSGQTMTNHPLPKPIQDILQGL